MTEPGKGSNKPLAKPKQGTGPKGTFLDSEYAGQVIDRLNALANVSGLPSGLFKFTLSDNNLVIELVGSPIIAAAIQNGVAGYYKPISTTPFTEF